MRWRNTKRASGPTPGKSNAPMSTPGAFVDFPRDESSGCRHARSMVNAHSSHHASCLHSAQWSQWFSLRRPSRPHLEHLPGLFGFRPSFPGTTFNQSKLAWAFPTPVTSLTAPGAPSTASNHAKGGLVRVDAAFGSSWASRATARANPGFNAWAMASSAFAIR